MNEQAKSNLNKLIIVLICLIGIFLGAIIKDLIILTWVGAFIIGFVLGELLKQRSELK